ncbi:ester cyclase [Auraticoccus monumenti]|uniref:Predicted ester cyclase n=1 Tax=Auraticoccus monumenti TaxID=675864 RepID=A0A1G6SQJ5_9ACTN|nr:ester cyclase [Auraticoccus monumenti]SDD19109.1 Predicted ester cyclase [Auraticoccus monumenti]
MSNADVLAHYLDCLNNRHLDDLDQDVHETLEVNFVDTALTDYQGVIASNIAAVPDFHWGVRDMLEDGDTIAVRFVDTGTPITSWFGLEATGRSFTMQETAFYHFRDGKLASVQFLLDLDAVRNDLAGTADNPATGR